MTNFYGLRPKCYAYDTYDGNHGKRSKGFSRRVIEKEVGVEDFKQCVQTGKLLYKEQILIRNRDHNMETIRQRKKALSCDDDKRILQPDGIHTYARGHFRTL